MFEKQDFAIITKKNLQKSLASLLAESCFFSMQWIPMFSLFSKKCK